MNEARELTNDERGILIRILESVPFPGRGELIEQVPTTRVVGGMAVFLDVAPAQSAPRSDCPDGPVPVRAFVEGVKGDPEGEILVWVEDGYLSALEFAWVTDEVPDTFPSPERVRPVSPDAG